MQGGAVKWNGHDVRDIDPVQLRNVLGYVNQDPVFFNFSLRDNMKLVNEEVTDQQIMDVLSIVDLNHWFSSLSHGLDTELGNMGDKLSGGQRQRLAVARILLKKELKFLILDEATAALD